MAGGKILLVDDDPDILDFLKYNLDNEERAMNIDNSFSDMAVSEKSGQKFLANTKNKQSIYSR